MLSRILYASLSNYSPKGISDLSVKSRDVRGAVKSGAPFTINSIFKYFDEAVISLFSPFLNDTATLIPVPRSSPIVEGALWPSKVIADTLVERGYGKEVSTCLERIKAVPKSSQQPSAETRPSVAVHLDSLKVVPEVIAPSQITLIDDIVTLGRTTFACALKLHEAYPNAEIYLFVLMRTKGLKPEIDRFIDPSVGAISYNPTSGKTSRHDE